ncbi:MAG TPA: hypothetical protein ENN18_08010 [Proteobacteria bacterium]|nr:hypothetical protein [Pseudomonadota bacterium]
MRHLRVSETFILAGLVPDDLKESIVEAVESVAESVFFENGKSLKGEVSGVDYAIASSLENQGWTLKRNFRPFQDNLFEVDLAFEDKKLLIEIEKGKLPRSELDIIKIASACYQFPKQWRFGALIVPSSYIELPLAGRQSPFDYLKRLMAVVQPIVAPMVEGFLVVGYMDPRLKHAPTE